MSTTTMAAASGDDAAGASGGGPEASNNDRHRQMQERFRAQQEARLQARQATRAQGEALKDPKESAGLFWAQLRATHDEVTRALDALALKHQERQGSPTAAEGEGAQEALARLLRQIEALEQRTTEGAALFLPPYDVRRAQEEAQALRGKLEATRAALAPRKKFSFAARRRGEQRERGGSAGGSGGGEEGQQPPPAAAAAAPPPSLAGLSLQAPASASGQQEPPMEGFEGREDEELDLWREMGPAPPRDLLLKDLRRCTVRLLAPLSFLRLEGLRGCRVLCGPVAGPVYLEDCEGCTLYLASRQLRIHTTRACDLYVHAVSGPIVEDCEALRFAPYLLQYPQLAAHMEAAQLAGTRNAWAEVKDFKWLRAQQSPHWALLPEGERKGEEVAAEGKEREEEEEEI